MKTSATFPRIGTLPRLLRRARRPAAVFAIASALLAGQAAQPAGAQDPSRPQKVIVQPGDTLSGIALRIYGSPAAVDRITAANKLSNPDMIVAGATLVVPPADSGSGGGGAPAASARQVTVESGDSLWAISLRVYGTAAYASLLASANGITDANMVFPGMKLTAPPAPAGGAAARATAGPLAGRRICLDPGHGGAVEPGAVFAFDDGKVLREADVVIDIARTLRGWLLADGAVVTMTRTSDQYLGLEDRAAICNASGADIAVSLHLNGADSPSLNGALTLFAKLVDRKLAELLGTSLQRGLSRNAPSAPFTSYGTREFEGRVLLRTAMPAVIVEPVFLTNPGEARALLSTTADAAGRRNQIVLETYRGIRMYFAN